MLRATALLSALVLVYSAATVAQDAVNVAIVASVWRK